MFKCLILKAALVLILLSFLNACTKSESSENGQDWDDGSSIGDESAVVSEDGEFRTSCGLVLNGKLVNPVSSEDGMLVTIDRILGVNLLSVNVGDGFLLVKLHGISASNLPSYKVDGALDLLNNQPHTAFLFQESENCELTMPDGGRGIIGQLFNPSGESYSELLLKAGVANVDDKDACQGELLANCYKSISTTNTAPANLRNGGRMLWKPVSDSDGNLAIHVDAFNVSVEVNGIRGTNKGPGNGFGSLARFSKSGCAFGPNARVAVFDTTTGEPYSIKGQHPYVVKDTCRRNEIY